MVNNNQFREWKQKYESRMKIGNKDVEQTINEYLPSMTPRIILGRAEQLLEHKLQACHALSLACMLPSRRFILVESVMLKAIDVSNKLDLQDVVLQYKGLDTDKPKTSSLEPDLGSAKASGAAVMTTETPACTEHRRFLAYMMAMTVTALDKSSAVEACTGVPSMMTLRPLRVQLWIAEELRRLALEEAVLRAKKLQIDLPIGLVRAVRIGDAKRVVEILS